MHNRRLLLEKINIFRVKEDHGLDTFVQQVFKMGTEHVRRATCEDEAQFCQPYRDNLLSHAIVFRRI